MKKGFSLLEVVLALVILGFSLPVLLTYMGASTTDTEKRMLAIYLYNMGKNVQNMLNATQKTPPVDAHNQAYCGYRNGVLGIAANAENFDGTICVLVRTGTEAHCNGSTTLTTYALYPWSRKKEQPLWTLPHGIITQSVVLGNY